MLRLLSWDASFCALCAALLLYGVAGSPTPDNPGWIEAAIGALLCVSMSWRTLSKERAAFLPLLIVGLSAPIAIAALNGVPFYLAARDVIPFLFWCLPLVIVPADNKAVPFLLICMSVATLFAARVLAQGLAIVPASDELTYLANSPLVLMSAIIGLCSAGRDLYGRTVTRYTVLRAVSGMICLLAMLIDVQRATITAVILSLGMMALIGLVKSPRRVILPVVIFAGVAVLGWDVVQSAWQGMAAKTAMVGVNMRWQEFLAVQDRLAGDWVHLVFGIGWGGRFDSPAVGGMSVPFTHSLLTYMFLKTGLLGLCAIVIALAACLRNLAREQSIFTLALWWAILIPTLFYASYKSLDFGLVLVLALLPPRAITFGRY